MLDTVTLPQVQAQSIIKSIYTKVGSESYRVELKYKVNGFFILRPTSGKPYQYILATAEQVNTMRLFPIFEVHHG